ncbi:hypothetical protein GS424_011170 [Eggerthella guodeyinii]|jgi:hypothetical protein|uniref:Uncharacterized protein n=2 Tax=Eggerthella TaxID=84111 RepID=A0A6L7IZJ4_9ACTN|nr:MULTISPECIES: hypothetical protein [Eggerthella]QOS67095.1 hypothetical protein GS424_011170 [Eggerthella guodeyinii]RGL81151.1 hypothetical protein DXC46_06820 [Eggerthella lenta]
MSGKKSTAAEVEMRTAKVAELLVNGWNRTRICEYARETAQWGVSDGQIDRYIATARERIQTDCTQDLKMNYALANARLEAIYSRAIEAGDLRLALSVVKEQKTLQGLDAEAAAQIYSEEDNDALSAVLQAYAEELCADLPQSVFERS